MSYRREDSAPHAGRLNDRLCLAFGAERVFMDIDDIPPGQDFTAALRENVKVADVVLVLIGPKWLSTASTDGRRRLDDERDFVRFEVAEALRQGKRVIPILVNDTPMPNAADLPGDLQPLLFCQALPLADARFNRDATDLIQALGGAGAPPAHLRRWIVTGGVVAILAAIAGWQLVVRGSRAPPVPPAPPPGPTTVGISNLTPHSAAAAFAATRFATNSRRPETRCLGAFISAARSSGR